MTDTVATNVVAQTKPEIHTLTYFIWEEFQNLMCDKLGIAHNDFRDYVHEPGAKQEDLWHFFMHKIWYDDVHNGSYTELYCIEPDEDEIGTWKEKALNAYNSALKDLEATGVPEVFVMVSW